MADIQRLTTVEQWEEALRGTSDKPMLLFKHSTQCPISAGAHDEFMHYIEDSQSSPVDFSIVRVIEERPVSNAIAEKLGVTHKSPQAILIKDGQPVWDTSHWDITYAFLSEKLGKPAKAE
jgi:bacillithiol system protein YtxJ